MYVLFFEGNHPATYCTVYKQLQDKKIPALHKKQPEQPDKQKILKVQ